MSTTLDQLPDAALADLLERVAEKVAEKIARDMRGIVADRTYPPDEAAELIGLRSVRRAKTIRSIPPALLPYVRVTPEGGRVGYLGRDLLRYLEDRRIEE